MRVRAQIAECMQASKGMKIRRAQEMLLILNLSLEFPYFSRSTTLESSISIQRLSP